MDGEQGMRMRERGARRLPWSKPESQLLDRFAGDLVAGRYRNAAEAARACAEGLSSCGVELSQRTPGSEETEPSGPGRRSDPGPERARSTVS